jgi:hypothetical protein
MSRSGEGGVQAPAVCSTARFLQRHPQVLRLAVVLVLPHRRLNLGPALLPQQLHGFLGGVVWLSLEELGQQDDLDPMLTLVTLPVRPQVELKFSTQPQQESGFAKDQLNQSNFSSISAKNVYLEQFGAQAALHGLVPQSYYGGISSEKSALRLGIKPINRDPSIHLRPCISSSTLRKILYVFLTPISRNS